MWEYSYAAVFELISILVGIWNNDELILLVIVEMRVAEMNITENQSRRNENAKMDLQTHFIRSTKWWMQ